MPTTRNAIVNIIFVFISLSFTNNPWQPRWQLEATLIYSLCGCCVALAGLTVERKETLAKFQYQVLSSSVGHHAVIMALKPMPALITEVIMGVKYWYDIAITLL